MPKSAALLAIACLCLLIPARLVRAQQYNMNGAPLFLGDAGTDQAGARAKVAEDKSHREEWEQSTLAADYDRVGKKDPRWDADARDGLTQYGKYLADAPALNRLANAPPLREGAKAALGRARAAGCLDPLVACGALALGLQPDNAGPADGPRLAAAAELALEKSEYAPARKFQASLRAAELAGRAGAQAAAATGRPPVFPPGTDFPASLDRARGHLVELARDASTPRAVSTQAMSDFLRVVRAVPETAGDRACVEMGKALEAPGWTVPAGDSAAMSAVAGIFWAGYAWRGNDDFHAGMIPDDRWKPFQERLGKARKALENAWRLDPADTRAAIGLMTVERGQHEGRERLELWFRRAMNTDPDSFDACLEKLDYLQPRWYGDAPQMIEFGHQCQATRNWPARLPFVLVEAHRRLAASALRPAEYWRQPDVWNDVRTVYGDNLAVERPDAEFERSGFAMYACTAGRWKVAAGLFKELGDHPNLRALGGMTPAQYKELVGQATALAAMKPEQADALTAKDEAAAGSRGTVVDGD